MRKGRVVVESSLSLQGRGWARVGLLPGIAAVTAPVAVFALAKILSTVRTESDSQLSVEWRKVLIQ